MIAALLIYSLALLAFAGDYAFGRPRRQAAKLAAKPAVDRAAQLATVGAAPAGAASDSVVLDGQESDAPESNEAQRPGSNATAPGAAAAGGPGTPIAGGADRPARPAGALRAIAEAGPWVRAAATLSAIGILAHVIAVTSRGF